MGDGYVRSQYGCNCFYNDSSYKRYNRAHLEGDTLIFNFNYGYQGGCGGGCGMGFWGGVGLGFGNFFGNLFGGNMWGGGMPWVCNWGGGGSSRVKDTDDGDYSSRRSRRNGSSGNADTPKQNKIMDKLGELKTKLNNGTDIKSDLATLKDELTKLAKDDKSGLLDAANGDDDIEIYKKLLLQVEALENGITDFNPDDSDFAVKGDNVTVKIGGKTINVTPSNLKELVDLAKTSAGRTSLKGLDKDTARMLLLKLGYINDDNWSHQYKDAPGNNSGKYLVGKFSNKPAIICLFEAAKIAVEVEKNQNATDHWFVGTITTDDNSFDNDGNLSSFNLKCTVGIYQGNYKITNNNDGTFTPTGDNINGTPVWDYAEEKVPLEFKNNSNGAKTSTGAK